MHATDLSPAAVQRAADEAEHLGVSMTFGVADMRTLATQVEGKFDVVLCCDNALPHLIADDDLLRAAANMRAKLRMGGLLLASIRDYNALARERPTFDNPRLLDGDAGRRIVFQLWDWSSDGRDYAVQQFILNEAAGQWQTLHVATRYRALLRGDLSAILQRAHFADVRWHMPHETTFYQPIVSARAIKQDN